MGFLDSLNKRRIRQNRENRIKLKSRRRKTFPEPDVQIDKILDKYGNQIYRRGTKAWKEMQARKIEGKQILKRTILHGIGSTTRLVSGESEKHKRKRLAKGGTR